MPFDPEEWNRSLHVVLAPGGHPEATVEVSPGATAAQSCIATRGPVLMERKERDSFAARIRPAVRSEVSSRPSRSSSTQTRIVEFRSGEAVRCHPDLICFLQEGWTIRSAAPCIVDSGNVRLLVVMEQQAATT